MELIETKIEGLYEVIQNKISDERGVFERLYCADELVEIFKGEKIMQVNHSLNFQVGTLRGLHYQLQPFAEIKFVNCIRGRIYDVAVDLRRNSETFLKFHSLELSPGGNSGLLIPKGCAHGFQVLEPDSEIIYFHTAKYAPQFERGIRFNDPKVSINWPLKVGTVSKKDSCYPLLTNDFEGLEL